MSEAQEAAEFEAVIDRDHLAEFLDPLAALGTDCVFDVDEDGLSVRCADPANVMMVAARLRPEAFEEFDADAIRFGYPAKRLRSLLEDAPDASLEVSAHASSKRFQMRVGSFLYTDPYTLPDSIRRVPDLPELDLPVEFSLRAGELLQAVEWAKEIKATHVAVGFGAREGRLAVAFEEKDGSRGGSYSLQRGELIDVARADEKAESTFSVDYLHDLASSPPEDAQLTVELGTEFPLSVSYDIAGGHGAVTIYQAPRIQS